MVFFAACSGVATTTNGAQQITGKLVSVDQASQSATFLYNGQQVTVNQLTSDQINTLKPLVGKTVTVQVMKTGDTTYNISVGTNIQVSDTSVTTTSTTTTTNNSQPTTTTANVAPGTIDFIGKVQSINASSITVTMPNGQAIQMAINTFTKRDNDLLPGQPTVGQLVKIDGYTNTDGSLTAKSLDVVKPDDQADTIKMNTVDFKGVTTSTVGTDNVLHFSVGNKSYSYTMNSMTRFKDFVNQQSIAANQPVKVEVLFNNGSNGTVTKVENGID